MEARIRNLRVLGKYRDRGCLAWSCREVQYFVRYDRGLCCIDSYTSSCHWPPKSACIDQVLGYNA